MSTIQVKRSIKASKVGNAAHLQTSETRPYTDYLNSLIKVEDMRYLPHRRAMRRLIPFQGRMAQTVLTPEQFEARQIRLEGPLGMNYYFSEHEYSNDPLIYALAQREKHNHSKILSTIIFISTRDKKGFEISGYIDYEQSLRLHKTGSEFAIDWSKIFQGSKRLVPMERNLSFISWKTGTVYYNNTDNFINKTMGNSGLCFIHKGDKRVIKIAKLIQENNSMCTFIESPKHGSAVLYDYLIHRKT